MFIPLSFYLSSVVFKCDMWLTDNYQQKRYDLHHNFNCLFSRSTDIEIGVILRLNF